MKTIRIGGVPEHYNLPFYQISDEQPFEQLGYRVEWTTYTTGTGAMLSDMKDQYLDISILLTEGIITDQHAGNSAKIIAHYVKSPLVWGVHKHAGSDISIDSISEQTRFAISRVKSGSHLMAYLYARKFELNLKDEQFEIVNNMNGAAMAMEVNQADLFLWEKYTTKPLVDKGIFERIDVCPTPWEPFVIVANQKVINEDSDFINALIEWLAKRTKEIKSHPDQSVEEIAEKFHLQISDVAEWFETVEWDVKPVKDSSDFQQVEEILLKLNIIQPIEQLA